MRESYEYLVQSRLYARPSSRLYLGGWRKLGSHQTLAKVSGNGLAKRQKIEPSVIAKHAIKLAQAFNKYYANVKILTEDNEKALA